MLPAGLRSESGPPLYACVSARALGRDRLTERGYLPARRTVSSDVSVNTDERIAQSSGSQTDKIPHIDVVLFGRTLTMPQKVRNTAAHSWI